MIQFGISGLAMAGEFMEVYRPLRELESVQLAAVIWAVAAAGLDGPILKPFTQWIFGGCKSLA